jgi:hypothetical protein
MAVMMEQQTAVTVVKQVVLQWLVQPVVVRAVVV